MRRLAALAVTLGLTLTAFAAPVPRQSPEFVITYPDGKQALLSSYKGKAVALLFIFTTCPHCQVTCQTLSKLNDELGAKGFQPIAVAINPMANMLVKEFAKEFRVNFPVGSAERDPALAYLQIPVVERWVVPQVVLIDKKGVIQKQTPPQGDEKLQEEGSLRTAIQAMLSGASAPAKHVSAAAKKPAQK
jgi:peroxiredoxin